MDSERSLLSEAGKVVAALRRENLLVSPQLLASSPRPLFYQDLLSSTSPLFLPLRSSAPQASQTAPSMQTLCPDPHTL